MDVIKSVDFEKDDLVILGCGYVGSFFLKKHPRVYFSNRAHKASVSENHQHIHFDLQNESTWKNIPDTKNVLWTFSAAENTLEATKAVLFFEEYLKNRNVVVLSSTSAYVQNFENESICENSPIAFHNYRFFAEENLRKSGALILHLSGIIGPERTPLNWYQKNLVTYAENILNYIHVQDIIFFIEKLFANFKPSERFNLTSRDYKTHQDISTLLMKMDLLKIGFKFAHQSGSKNSKKVQCQKILDYLKQEDYLFKKYPEDVETRSPGTTQKSW